MIPIHRLRPRAGGAAEPASARQPTAAVFELPSCVLEDDDDDDEDITAVGPILSPDQVSALMAEAEREEVPPPRESEVRSVSNVALEDIESVYDDDDDDDDDAPTFLRARTVRGRTLPHSPSPEELRRAFEDAARPLGLFRPSDADLGPARIAPAYDDEPTSGDSDGAPDPSYDVELPDSPLHASDQTMPLASGGDRTRRATPVLRPTLPFLDPRFAMAAWKRAAPHVEGPSAMVRGKAPGAVKPATPPAPAARRTTWWLVAALFVTVAAACLATPDGPLRDGRFASEIAAVREWLAR